MPHFDRLHALRPQSPQTIDAMPLAELERRISHAHALLEQAEDLLPGVSRLTVEVDLVPGALVGREEWMARRAVLARLAKRAAQLGARLTDAAWCMEQQARAELIEAPLPTEPLLRHAAASR